MDIKNLQCYAFSINPPKRKDRTYLPSPTLRNGVPSLHSVWTCWLLVLGLAVVLYSCAPPLGPENSPATRQDSESGPTGSTPTGARYSLTIVNSSSSELTFVRWTDASGTGYAFSPDRVYDAVLQKTVGGMMPGSSQTLTAAAGTNALRFFFASGGPEYRTIDKIETGEDAPDVTYTLTDAIPIQGGT